MDTQNMDIGRAIKEMWNGEAVARRGWNGKGMYLKLQVPDAHSKMTLPYVFMSTAQGDYVPWLCSQTDLLARDWEVVIVLNKPENLPPIAGAARNDLR